MRRQKCWVKSEQDKIMCDAKFQDLDLLFLLLDFEKVTKNTYIKLKGFTFQNPLKILKGMVFVHICNDLWIPS